MAALLRSARLLKLSPSGLLQITGTKRNGPPLSRLYYGAIGSKGTRVGARQVAPGSTNISRCLWPYAGVRAYAGLVEHKDVSNDSASPGLHFKQAQQFDWALAKLDSSVRRTGRVTKTLLLHIFHDIARAGSPSSNQALLLLRSCGSLLPEMPLKERNELAHRIWDKLQELGVSYDASHFNALLKVYLQNEFKFSPTEFLAKMEASNVQPNRVTFQRLITAYCHEGDIEGASTILGFMKNKDLPITEAVFNSLITGHSRAGDMESAENILPVMRSAGIEPGPDTYVALLNAYAERGEMDKIKNTLDSVESAEASLMDRDFMQVIYSLAKAGHQHFVPEMVERMRLERGYIPDAMNLCLSLITQGLEDTAFIMLKTFPTMNADGSSNDDDAPTLGNFFLRHCVNMGKPMEKIAYYCKELQESSLHTSPVPFALHCALDAQKTGMAVELMKIMKDQGLPIRPHFFWPLLIQYGKTNNTAGVLEVVKGMQELDVAEDVDTFSNYILPAFPDVDSARIALKEVGCSLGAEDLLPSEVRSEAFRGNLDRLYTMLSSSSFPSLDIGVFRGSLLNGFRKSQDVENMAKITELLYKDTRFSLSGAGPAEAVSYFLYKLIERMNEGQVHAQEDKLREYFSRLKTMNITIPLNIYRGIRNILDSHNVPELIKDVLPLVDDKDQPVNHPDLHRDLEGKVQSLEKKLADLKAEGKPLSSTVKYLILALCANEKLEQALVLKEQHEEDMVAGGYAALINLCCRQDKLEEALQLKTELGRKDSSAALDASKYISLVRILSEHGRLEEALDMLKEMKEKEVVMNDANVAMLFHLLSAAAARGDITAISRLQDTLFTLGLVKPSANLCSPLVSAHMESGDLVAALEAAMDCQRRYGKLPPLHNIIVGLVTKGDTELLQKAMDFVSQERGEMIMLYDLFFAFMQTGRYREARKIIETPGLRARPSRMQWYAEKCINNHQMEPLETMVDMTGKLFECDRDEMYSYILRLCKKTNDWAKAEAVWTKMQEENIVPRERTLRMLADILKANGHEVPFEVPEVWYNKEPAQEQSKPAKMSSYPELAESTDYHVRLLTLCKRGKAKEAYGILKEVDKMGVALGPAPYDGLIRALLAEGALEDALVVKDIAASHIPGFHLSGIAGSLMVITLVKKDQVKEAMASFKAMLQADQVISRLAITRLLQGLGNQGNAQGIQEVKALIKGTGSHANLSSMVFVNNTALAHIRNGDLDAAVEVLEAVYTLPAELGSTPNQPSMSFVFRKLLEDNNSAALDKLSAMAERLANHFASYRAASDLFLELLKAGKIEDAKFMLARCNPVAEQKEFLTSYVAQLSQKPNQVGKIKTLLNLIPDFAEKDVVCFYLMKCYGLDKDLPSAKLLYDQMQKEGMTVDDLSLKRLALLYRGAGETAPFKEPPESFKFYADKLREKKFSQASNAEE